MTSIWSRSKSRIAADKEHDGKTKEEARKSLVKNSKSSPANPLPISRH
jgi:hypothetical protein